MNNFISYSFIFVVIIGIIISILGFSPINQEDILISESGYTWPLPGKYYISSYFGYRDLNLIGSGPFHSGIDIPGPAGTYFVSAMPRKSNLSWI